jgi:RNA polymerase sigma factor (TIGR02999 family)
MTPTRKVSSEKGGIPKEDRSASLNLSRVMPAAYDELRRLARHYLARERAGQTLQATALVNEAYLRLQKERTHVWQNRAHFCAIAAGAMREILVERARARAASKRGGSRIRVTMDDTLKASDKEPVDVLALHEALDRFALLDPRLARLVELRFFGGLTIEETAEALESSTATIKRNWKLARAWLTRELGKSIES